MNCTLNYDSEQTEEIIIFVCSKCLFGIVSGNDCVAVMKVILMPTASQYQILPCL